MYVAIDGRRQWVVKACHFTHRLVFVDCNVSLSVVTHRIVFTSCNVIFTVRLPHWIIHSDLSENELTQLDEFLFLHNNLTSL